MKKKMCTSARVICVLTRQKHTEERLEKLQGYCASSLYSLAYSFANTYSSFDILRHSPMA